jgi:hypothetical protein
VKRYVAKAVKGWCPPGRERRGLALYRTIPGRQKARVRVAAFKAWAASLDALDLARAGDAK